MAPRFEELRIILGGLRDYVLKNYLVVAFVVALTVSLAAPRPGQAVLEPQVLGVHIVTFINIVLVFFISGLTLRTDEMKQAFTKRNALGSIWGFVSIVGVTPLLVFAVRHLPFTPPEYATGLAIFTVVPTTLGVGISLVTSAKGNIALSILLTVATNCIGVIVIPLWLKASLRPGMAGVEGLNINLLDIFVKLLISFFVPTVIGKGLRELLPPVRKFAQEHKQALGLISNTNLALIIWQTLSSGREIIVNTPFGTMLLVIVAALVIHLIYLAFNSVVVALLRLPPPEAACVTIMASQKSAPVAVTVITYIAASNPAAQGLLAVPCVVGQLVQIFVGQPLANYLGGKIKRWQQHQSEALVGGGGKDAGGGGAAGGEGKGVGGASVRGDTSEAPDAVVLAAEEGEATAVAPKAA